VIKNKNITSGMMALRQIYFLDGMLPDQQAKWCSLWDNWPHREVFAHPDYVRLFAQPGDRIMCAAMETAGGGIIFPFIMRPLARESWMPSDAKDCDIVSPYGYGGAFAWNCSENDASDFWSDFEAWAVENKIISSFVRLSLFAEQQIPFAGMVASDRLNVVRPLSLTPDELWYDFEHKVRKNVNCAKRSNVIVEIDLQGRRLDDFLDIYYSTMDRRGADGAYYFSKQFFESLIHNLTGQYAFFHAKCNGVVVSTELVLVSANNIYSFLGGTSYEALAQRPNDLLKYEIIVWGSYAGKKNYVLGGGYGVEDGIYRYKKSFAPNGILPFYVGKQIYDRSAYDHLVLLRRAFEEIQNKAWTPKSGYFPEYRA
jgi:hypothetical protein